MSIDLIHQIGHPPAWPRIPALRESAQRRAGSLGSADGSGGARLRQSLTGVHPIDLQPVAFPTHALATRYSAVIGPSGQHYEGSVQLSFSSPQVNLEWPSTSLRVAAEHGQITIHAALDSNATLIIELFGKVTAGGASFKPEEVRLQIDSTGDDARLHFIASSLVALLALSPSALRVPAIGLMLEDLRFDLPLKQIGEQLRTSKTAYKLMVIARATGNRMDFRPVLSGEDLQILTLIYRAIVDRTFDWPLATYPPRAPATRAAWESLSALPQPAPMTFVREDVSQELMGRLIPLGAIKVYFKQAVIKDRDAFLQSLASEDGQEMETDVIALDGRARIECTGAPSLPDNPWTVEEEKLIALGPHLSDLLAVRYDKLAAATLAGLTADEQAEITARPELDEDAKGFAEED
jgi:hypothetical protein